MLPKYVKRVRVKGRTYYYFDTGKRVDGRKVYTRLPDLRDLAFGGSYAVLMGHRNRAPARELMTVPKLIDLFQRSADYRDLSENSKKHYDIYLSRLAKLLPTAPAPEVARHDMQRLIDGMADTPGAANAFRRSSSAMFTWGRKRGYITANPCEDIDPLDIGEHEPWPENILTAALAADDARVRLLTHMLYYTAQRIGDIVRMPWSAVEDGRVQIVTGKTKAILNIPQHTALKVELARTPREAVVICTDRGRRLTEASARKILQTFTAGLGVETVPHGLRKKAINALLEAGCSMAETAAISKQSLQVVEHYAKKRDQVKLADAAILRWQNAT